MENFSQLNSQNELFLVAIFALIFGSFASLLSHRLASKEPIIFARSKCLNCGTALKILNLIPLFSWIFQRGKCSKCHTKISLRYPIIELGFLISFVTIYFVLDQEVSWKMLLYFLIAGTLIVMCVVDLEQYFIPDSTQYFLVILVTLLLIAKGGTDAVIINIPAAFLYAGFGLTYGYFFILPPSSKQSASMILNFFSSSDFYLALKTFWPS